MNIWIFFKLFFFKFYFYLIKKQNKYNTEKEKILYSKLKKDNNIKDEIIKELEIKKCIFGNKEKNKVTKIIDNKIN